MKNKIWSICLLSLVIWTACDDDEFTGHSQLSPSSPTVSVNGVSSDAYSFVETDSTIVFTIELSEAQIVDVKVFASQTGGDATEGSDFDIDHEAVIPKGRTSAEIALSIYGDGLPEDTETIQITIGDDRTANAGISPTVVEVEIMNLATGDLSTDMVWSSDSALDPTVAGDLVLEIRDADGAAVGSADGGSFENWSGWADLADGTYSVVSYFYATGDTEMANFDVSLIFNQVGVMTNNRMDFPGAFNNATPCTGYDTQLARVTKSGDNYTIESAYANSWSADVTTLEGSWTGDDGGYASQIVSASDGTTLTLDGMNAEWMFDFWGEEVLSTIPAVVTLEFDALGRAVIDSQDYMMTLYDGAEYPYTISGSAVINTCGETPSVTLLYKMDQEGFDVAGWLLDNGYTEIPYFTATINL